LFNNNDKKIKNLINELLSSDLRFLDIGAAGGLNKRWEIISKKLLTTLVEPNKHNANLLEQKGYNVLKKCFYSKQNTNLKFYETRDKYCSSIYKPNKNYLINFPKYERFDIINEVHENTTIIDEEFDNSTLPHFIKIDTEGSELDILKGAEKSLNNILGFEIECEFFELRNNQPLFSDVKIFLEKYNFEFIDFLHITRWERNNHRSTGQPQITDCLFLKKPIVILNNFNNKIITENLLSKYIAILALYNRSDLIYYFLNNLDRDFINKFQLRKLHELIEKKIKKINIFERITLFVKNCVHNQI